MCFIITSISSSLSSNTTIMSIDIRCTRPVRLAWPRLAPGGLAEMAAPC